MLFLIQKYIYSIKIDVLNVLFYYNNIYYIYYIQYIVYFGIIINEYSYLYYK